MIQILSRQGLSAAEIAAQLNLTEAGHIPCAIFIVPLQVNRKRDRHFSGFICIM